MRNARRARDHRRPGVSRWPGSALLLALGAAMLPSPASAQDLTDVTRLRGTGPLAVRASVAWDEQITTSAGGATEDQYHDAVLQTFRSALEETGVPLDEGADTVVLCRVETFYDQGLIAYAVRVELLQPVGPAGMPAIVWQRSWVGTSAVGGLHRMFSLGEQCAEDFAAEWAAANPS